MSYRSAWAVFFSFLLHCTISNSSVDDQEDLSRFAALSSVGERGAVCQTKKSPLSFLGDSRTEDRLWRSGKESDITASWDSCRILFAQLNCMRVSQMLELAPCL